uniref:Uncharacterized protein LOC101511998 n=1 Tax=Cicer arietinum TaxID=3827 RepID=A0A1S2YD22_CICAR|nr:uncharacterized protein LOC101511998 [Cicer arietinum]
MEKQNLKYRGWCPSNTNNYEIHEVGEPALRKRLDRPRRDNKKGHVAFKTVLEEAITPLEVAETERVNSFESVDRQADAFIKLEHRRIELARLKSLGFA